METTWIPAETSHSDEPTPYPLIRVQASKTQHLEFPLNTPPWEIHRAVMLYLAKLAIQRSKQPLFLSGLTAALQYGAPTWNQHNTIYLGTKTGTNNQKNIGCYTGPFAEKTFQKPTLIKRQHKNYPENAVSLINGIPTLNAYVTVLELLCLTDPYEAFVSADGLARKALQFNRFNKVSGLELWKRILPDLQKYISIYFAKKYHTRLLRRLKLVDPFAESAAETAVRVTLYQLGITNIESQKRVVVGGKERFGDLYLPEYNTIIEIDGNEKYTSTDAYAAEKDREVLLTAEGFIVVRVNSKELRLPDFARILAAKLHVPMPRKLKVV